MTEFADRKMAEGMDRRQAYASASKRMAAIIASTLTTLAVFFLFFSGQVLWASFEVLAIDSVGNAGSVIIDGLNCCSHNWCIMGKQDSTLLNNSEYSLRRAGEFEKMTGFGNWYARKLSWLLIRPLWVLSRGPCSDVFHSDSAATSGMDNSS